MNHAEAVERAAAVRAKDNCADAWEDMPDLLRMTFRDAAHEMLVASGYPAALTEATQLIGELERYLLAALRSRETGEGLPKGTLTHDSGAGQTVQRARMWLADYETAAL